MRIVYVGMGGTLSLAPLTAVLRAGYTVEAVVVPGPADQPLWQRRRPDVPTPSSPTDTDHIPLNTTYVERSIVHLAWEQQIAVLEAGDLNAAQVREQWRRLAPDLVLVSCFPRRIPVALLTLPQHGFLNLHPSLLPAYRGPFPLFWQLRDGLRQGGVTIHFMSQELDAGDIVLQEPLHWPAGISGATLEQRAGELGGGLFVQALQQLQEGTLPRRQQPDGGSYQPAPVAADFALNTDWSAQHAYNFMRGTSHWGFPYPVSVSGETLRLRKALEYDPHCRLSTPWLSQGPYVSVQFAPGVLRATLAA